MAAHATFRIGQAAAVLGVSPDTVRRLVDGGRLAAARSEGGHRLIDGPALARLATELAADAARPGDEDHHRVVPAATTVARSARNSFPGIVTRVLRDGVMAQVEIQAGPHRIVSLMTREAADDLGLEPGVAAVASVKSTNVVVELPAP